MSTASTADAFIQQRLLERKRKGNFRELKVAENLIDFSSNDYLGFARCHQLHLAIENEWRRQKNSYSAFIGATGSRLLTGNHRYAEDLEQSIAEFHDAEAGLIFNSGYLANMALISTVVQPEDTVIFDTCLHASTREGMQSCKCRRLPWRHNDLEHLERRLKQKQKSGNAFVCVESIYSCDGTQAPLQEICDLCSRYEAYLIVDEAHATGIIGEQGKGLVVHHQCQTQVFARVHTFSKALGCQGAIVLGSAQLKELLVNYAWPFIYTTALSLPSFVAIACAYEKLRDSEKERQKLNELVRYFKRHVEASQLSFIDSKTPIQAICFSGNHRVQSISQYIAQRGFDVRALMSPTVQQGYERLRICLHAFNAEGQIDDLFNIFASLFYA
jgi:8-amino-7-oxononanoate synthase